MTSTKVDEAKAALERGDFDAAFRLSEEAQTEAPEDSAAREMYAVIHLARAIRLSDRAREARRQDLLRREIDYDEEFQDSPEVARAYDEAAAAIDDVLRVAPDHWKTRMLKAALVFRRDRESGRPVALEILQALAAADPTNKQIPFTIRKIERPCVRCGDTGFCPHCKGRGQRRFAVGSARRVACSDHSSSSCRSARAGSFPSIHSTRSARPISPQRRHSQPSA
ncbi:MAG: hypothetical protein E6J97_08170 [Methanobacteriota archaeon]|nr:MAG: hypothetical protein E6J97_08170 [Euryarchaeota archaeon]